MPSAQYRPLDTGNGRPIPSASLRGPHGSKLRALFPKSANSRRMFVCVILLMMLLVYVVWCAVANYTDEGRTDALVTTGKFEAQYHNTSQRSQGWNIWAVGAPLMLEKLNAEPKTINDYPLYFNSSPIGLGISTISPTQTKPNANVDDIQRLASE